MDNRLMTGMPTEPPTASFSQPGIVINPELASMFTDTMPGDEENQNANIYEKPFEEPAINYYKDEFSEEDLISQFNIIFTEADDAKKNFADIWQEIVSMYNNEDDFSRKADWQSKEVIPRTFTMTENVTSMFQRALMTIPDWFSITKTFRNDDVVLEAKINLVTKMVKYFLEKNEYPFLFGKTVKAGLLSYLLINKVTWSYEGDLLSDTNGFSNGGCIIELISPFDFWLDPTGRGKYTIQKTVIDYGDFMEAADNGVFINADKLESDYRDMEEESEENERKEMPSSITASRKEVVLHEYWGNVYHKDGRLVYKNCMFIVANKKYIVKAPIENPNKNKKSPYVITGSIDTPFGVYHKSLLGVNIGLFKLITELANQAIDSNNFSILKNFQIDKEALEDPSDIDDGIFPGKVWATNYDTQNPQPIRVLEFGQPPQSIFTLAQLIDREIQSSGVTEYVTGLPRMKGRPTATEVTQKLAQSNSLFDTLARNVEYHFLTPLVKLVYETIVQNIEYFLLDEEFVKAVPEARSLRGVPPELRYKELAGDFAITVSGLSIVLNRQAELEKVNAFMNMLGNNQQLASQMDWNKLGNKVLEGLNWTSADILLDPVKAAEQQKQMIMQQMAAAGQLNNQVIPGQPSQELQSGQVIPGQPPQSVPPPVMNPQIQQQMFGGQQGQPDPRQIIQQLQQQMQRGGRR
jgi:hypothetical protein